MASETFIVTIDSPHPLASLVEALQASYRDVVKSYSVSQLTTPDLWPTQVWVAFERAQAERTRRNVEATDTRRDTGNTLVHPPVRVSPAETLADHSPLHFPADTGQRTAPHGDPLLSECDGKPVVCRNTINHRA